MYTPLNYEQINLIEGHINPSQVKSYNNATYAFWERALFQRACSVLEINLPDTWQGAIKDFFFYCLFKLGYVAVFDTAKYGISFQPCTLSGYNFYYQPIRALISNPLYNADLEIGKDCELIKLTPDYMGIWDIISYYAEKLSTLDNAINMSLINNKFAFALGAKNKAAAQALKKIFDKINAGEPTIIFDKEIVSQREGNEPWNFLERHNLKDSYLTTMQLQDMQTLLNNFDTEIGIPTLPFQKKERMITSEAESKVIDATSRSIIWLETLTSSLKLVNDRFNLNITAELRYKPTEPKGGVENE